MPDKPPTANQITAELLLKIPRAIPNVWVWRNNRIDAKAVGRNGKMRHVSAGINGQGDLSGMATIDMFTSTGARKKVAVRVELEVKSHNDHIRLSQEAFGGKVKSMGGIYLIVSDPEQGIADLREELCQLS